MILSKACQFFLDQLKPALIYALKPSSWFLLLIIGCVLVYSLSSLNLYKQRVASGEYESVDLTSTVQMELLVISQSTDSFGQNQYIVFSGGNFWQATSAKSVLRVGRSYRVQAKTQLFEAAGDNTFETYFASLGQTGRLKIQNVQAKSTQCDLTCRIIETRNSVQYGILNAFSYNSCHKFYVWNQILGLDKSYCQNNYALSMGLTLGGSDYFTQGFRQSFKNLGLSHLVAFSGFQVVLLTGWVEFWLVRIRLNPRYRFGLILLVCLGIVWLIGPLPPVLRSVLSLLISQSALVFIGRRVSPVRGLLYSAAAMLAVNPLYLINISFQLSFLATLAIILISVDQDEQGALRQTALLSRQLQVIRQSGLQALAAFILTYPVVAGINSQNSILAIPINALLAPIINWLTLGNLFSLIPVVGDLMAIFVNLSQIFLIWSVTETSRFSESLRLFYPSGWNWAAAVCLILISMYRTILQKQTIDLNNRLY